jgi:hypothetical protein
LVLSRKTTIFAAAMLAAVPALAQPLSGKVIDASTSKPIEGAIITSGDKRTQTALDGTFKIDGNTQTLGIRAYGYGRTSVSAETLAQPRAEISLLTFKPKALYLSFFGVGSSHLRDPALSLIAKTELNAVVIDVKGDRGMVIYKSAVPLTQTSGAQSITTVRDPRALLAQLHRDHIYAIARIVVFKDDPLATARPDLAVKRAGGAIFRDREKLAWTDPFKSEVWDYNIAIAVEAAQLGFDEIQFDYVRFPDAPGLKFSKPTDMKSRMGAISGFLAEAYDRLAPYNVFVAADIFGYVTWNLDDTHIGQRLEELSPTVDYISPMLYPSCFQFGIPGYRLPIAHPYEIVFLSLQNARERSGIPSIRFRPWLQAFRDYAFDHREYGANEIRAQTRAADKFGSDGWMLWNPRNTYTGAGLKAEGEPCLHDSAK